MKTLLERPRRNSPNAPPTTTTATPVHNWYTGRVIEHVTHQAIFTCAVLCENPAEHGVPDSLVEAVRQAGIEMLEGLFADQAMQSYWEGADAVEVVSCWARM
jgi:hypothetical protein